MNRFEVTDSDGDMLRLSGPDVGDTDPDVVVAVVPRSGTVSWVNLTPEDQVGLRDWLNKMILDGKAPDLSGHPTPMEVRSKVVTALLKELDARVFDEEFAVFVTVIAQYIIDGLTEGGSDG